MSVLADEKRFHDPPTIFLKKRDSIVIAALTKEITYRLRNALRHYSIYRDDQLIADELREELKKLKHAPRALEIALELLALEIKGELPPELFIMPTFRVVKSIMLILGGDTEEDAAKGWQLFLTYRADTR
ncbi:hypothetical protein ES704_03587 [subsurface metagenome]|jgi:hypothetical protein